MFKVSVDGLPLTLIELDGTATTPITLPFIYLNVAQRASFVLDWTQLQLKSPVIRFRFQPVIIATGGGGIGLKEKTLASPWLGYISI
jgi:hypothetical protein